MILENKKSIPLSIKTITSNLQLIFLKNKQRKMIMKMSIKKLSKIFLIASIRMKMIKK